MKNLISLILLFQILACSPNDKKKKKNNVNEKENSSHKFSIQQVLQEQLKKGLKATIGNAVYFQNQYNDEDIKSRGTDN